MTDQQVQDLQTMIQDMESQSALYKPTNFWKDASLAISKEFIQNDMKGFRSFSTCMGMFAPTYAFPLYLKNKTLFTNVKKTLKVSTQDKKSNIKLDMLIRGEAQAFSDYRVLNASNKDFQPYTDKVSESNIGNPPEQFTFEERTFSRSFLNYLLGLNFLKKHVDTTSIKTVLEIGGGFGTLGEILLSDKRNNCFYINVDIPPVVFASSYYLKELFGEKNIGDYSKLREEKVLSIEKLKQEYKALDLCSWQLPKLEGTIDLFVNFISFQEMEPDIVQNYCNHISRLAPKYILLRNIQEGKKQLDVDYINGVKEPIIGDRYDTFFPEYQLIQTDASIFGLKMEDGFHSQLRLYIKN